MHHRRFNGWTVVLFLFVALVAMTWGAAQAQAASPAPALADLPEWQRDGDDGGSDDGHEWRGLIKTFPAEAGGRWQGTWVVTVGSSDREFIADAETEFDVEDGAFAAGVCVKVETASATSNIALEIDSESDCDGNHDGGDDGNGDDDGDDDGDDNGIEAYGRIVAPMPARNGQGRLEGQLTIQTRAGEMRTFQITERTRFEYEHGPLGVGTCVEVEAHSSTPTVAEKIESESAYKCRSGDDDDGDGAPEFEGLLFGIIEALPGTDDYTGDWTVSGIDFTVTAETELDFEDDRAFELGDYARVEFREDQGDRVATEVKLIYNRRDDDDDSGDHEYDWRFGHAWGTLTQTETAPGSWIVAGISYRVTEQTRLMDEPMPIAIGGTVKVKFYLDDAGNRIAVRIQATRERGEVDEANMFRFVSSIGAKPADGTLIGDWLIGGVEFVTTDQTRFDDDEAMFVVGAWVSVKYFIDEPTGDLIIAKIEVEVPPDAGDDDRLGRIERRDDDAAAAAALNVWRIGGVDYVVSPATDFDDSGLLDVGSMALVNSYVTSDGSNVATRIAGFTLATQIFLPVLER